MNGFFSEVRASAEKVLEQKANFRICFDWNEKTGIESKARLITVRRAEGAKVKVKSKDEIEAIEVFGRQAENKIFVDRDEKSGI